MICCCMELPVGTIYSATLRSCNCMEQFAKSWFISFSLLACRKRLYQWRTSCRKTGFNGVKNFCLKKQIISVTTFFISLKQFYFF